VYVKSIFLEKIHAMETYNDAKTRLLTLLNVSHLRELKRNPDFSAPADLREPPAKRVKLNQRATQVAEPLPKSSNDAIASTPGDALENDDAEAGTGTGTGLRWKMISVRLFYC